MINSEPQYKLGSSGYSEEEHQIIRDYFVASETNYKIEERRRWMDEQLSNTSLHDLVAMSTPPNFTIH